MLDRAAGHWLKKCSAARNGTAPHGAQITVLMVSAHLPHPKPLGTKTSAPLAAAAVLLIGKLVIFTLENFLLRDCNPASFLRFSLPVQPCAYNAFYAASRL